MTSQTLRSYKTDGGVGHCWACLYQSLLLIHMKITISYMHLSKLFKNQVLYISQFVDIDSMIYLNPS